MIWHIIRKDLRLLWVLAASVAAVNLCNDALLMSGGSFQRAGGNDGGQFSVVSNLALPAIGLLGLALLVISVLQLDRLPGSSQDWLTRPIPRGTLFTSKLLFVIVVGLLPIFLGDVAMGLAVHFDLGAVLAASGSRSVALLCLICVPAALVATVTATLSEALVFVVGLLVILIAEVVTVIELQLFEPGWPTGFGWIATWIFGLFNVGVLLLAIPLQLRWRAGNRLRWILLAVFSLEPAIAAIPMGAVMRIQHAVGPGAHASVSVEADPGRRPTIRISVQRAGGRETSSTLLTVPVTIVGTEETDRVVVDRAVLRLVPPTGATQTGKLAGEYVAPVGSGPLLLKGADARPTAGELSFWLPTDLFVAAKALHAKAEVRLFGTDFRADAGRSLATLRHEPLDGHTRCYVHQRPLSEEREVTCESTRDLSDCWELRAPTEDVAHLNVNPVGCRRPDYEPWPVPVWRDAYYSGLVGQFSFKHPPGFDDASSAVERGWEDSLVVLAYTQTVHFIDTIEFPVDAAQTSGSQARSRDGVGEAARFAAPVGMVADRRGDLFVVDADDSVIRKITPIGEVSTLAGMPQKTGAIDGPGRDARFDHPSAIGIDQSDNLFVVDAGRSTVRKITPGGNVTTVDVTRAEGVAHKSLRLKNLGGISAGADGNLYVIADSALNPKDKEAMPGSRTILKIAPDGTVSTLAGP
jgi:hypothetical protein